MEIKAEIIKGICYTPFTPELKEYQLKGFDINSCSTCCVVSSGQYQFGLSKWVSPKRSRSYPYERVYNTLGCAKRITVIPIIKDEGKAGDRDFLQWDTISLMSLLDVHVILAYYDSAEKHSTRENKITGQQFHRSYINQKLKQISNYHSSALHWNMKEIEESLSVLAKKAKASYKKISKKLDVELHTSKGIEKFQDKIDDSIEAFRQSSRDKAGQAQLREFVTSQPNEELATDTKAKITITNFLGGCYYFTTDEIEIKGKQIFLIEAKHSKNSKLPSRSDIKDGLLKMILYKNLENVNVQGKKYMSIPVLKLTSSHLTGKVSSECSSRQRDSFSKKNSLSIRQQKVFTETIQEGLKNDILIRIEGV